MSGSGTARTDAEVLGGPNVGGPLPTSTSWRLTVIDRWRKSTRSTVSPKHSPCRSPVPAASVTSARYRSGISARTDSTCSTVGGTIASAGFFGSRTPLAGFRATSRSATASARIAEKIRKTTSTVAGARTPEQPFTHAWTSLGRIDPIVRSPKIGSAWLRRWASTWATVVGRCTCAACQLEAYSPNVTLPAAGSRYEPSSS